MSVYQQEQFSLIPQDNRSISGAQPGAPAEPPSGTSDTSAPDTKVHIELWGVQSWWPVGRLQEETSPLVLLTLAARQDEEHDGQPLR